MFGERSSRDAYFFETAKRILQDSSISEEILRLDPLIIAFSIFSNLPDDNPIDFLCTSLTTLRWYRWKCVEAFGDNHSATSHYAISDQLKNRLNALAIQQDHLIIRVLLQGMSGWIGDGKIDPGLLDRLLRLVCEAIHGILVERPCLIAKILEPEDGAKAELLPFLFEYCPNFLAAPDSVLETGLAGSRNDPARLLYHLEALAYLLYKYPTERLEARARTILETTVSPWLEELVDETALVRLVRILCLFLIALPTLVEAVGGLLLRLEGRLLGESSDDGLKQNLHDAISLIDRIGDGLEDGRRRAIYRKSFERLLFKSIVY